MLGRQASLANQAREASVANDPSAAEYHAKNLETAMSCPLCRAKLPCNEKETFEASLNNAKKGKAYAQHAVATKYEAGRGTRKNLNKAAKYFRAAAEQGHPWSMSSYGNLLEKGLGVGKDIGEAKKWYERSAELKQPQGYYHQGNLYENGIGVQKDEAKAARLYRVAADMGFDIAQCSLGCCYDFGTGLPENPEQALGTNATAMGNVSSTMLKIAAIRYGRCDVAGKSPVPKAVYWGKRAAKLGNEEAAAAVKQIDDLLSGVCANCNKPASSVNLKRCTKCRVFRYCGRDCQREHWKAGHKLDCCKTD
ncbi:hypothetical protein THAOC_34616 [Thalassiosira oceanica]|uniref:MYND-type domain-containing protein n=1 Tax=Thalassiosira oceanica TaxID=159749 RepID=K0R392_THAOC|nr:hypothetical protein THAOC_34616 [Thalassiosira oceanica]|eukprot:EJK46710.1 hypothetical protein THAOC_34616 [Thalassiosira oceanica]